METNNVRKAVDNWCDVFILWLRARGYAGGGIGFEFGVFEGGVN